MAPTKDTLEKRKLELECQLIQAKILNEGLEAEDAARDKRLYEAGNWFNGIFQLVGEIEHDDIHGLISEISEFRRFRPQKTVTLVLNSPGGYNTAGLALYAFLQALPRSVVHVRGWAASMAPVVLQAAKKRIMDREAHIMIHKSSAGISRIDADNFMDEAELLKSWSEQTGRILCSRSKLTMEEWHAKTDHRDWNIPAAEALKLALVDELV